MITDSTLKTILESVIFDLEDVKRVSKDKYTHDKLTNLIDALNAIERDINSKEYKNMAKRLIYTRMKRMQTDHPEESRQLYILYQRLKSGTIDTEQAIEMMINGLNRP